MVIGVWFVVVESWCMSLMFRLLFRCMLVSMSVKCWWESVLCVLVSLLVSMMLCFMWCREIFSSLCRLVLLLMMRIGL